MEISHMKCLDWIDSNLAGNTHDVEFALTILNQESQKIIVIASKLCFGLQENSF